MKKDDAYDSDSCGEDYAGQPPDDDQSFIVPRRGLEPDTGPDDDPMTVQRRGSPSDTDSFVSEEDMDEYPDEYSDDGDELDTFILPYPTGSKLGKKKRKKKHKKKSKKKSGASSKGVDILKLAASMEGDDEDVQLTDDEQKRRQRGGSDNQVFVRWKKICLKKRALSIERPCYITITVNTMNRLMQRV